MTSELELCPFCGVQLEIIGAEKGALHPNNEECILSNFYLKPSEFNLWNTRLESPLQRVYWEIADAAVKERDAFLSNRMFSHEVAYTNLHDVITKNIPTILAVIDSGSG